MHTRELVCPAIRNQDGYVVIRLPLPPGCMPTLWNDDERFLEYMNKIPGCYVTGDGGYFDEDGYLFIMGRIDDVINVAGHRLSTGAMEEVLSGHPDVAECAVLGGQRPVEGSSSLEDASVLDSITEAAYKIGYAGK